MIRRWLRHAALEPDELRTLQAAFDALKTDLDIRAESELHALANDLMTAYERFYPDCALAMETVRATYLARD